MANSYNNVNKIDYGLAEVYYAVITGYDDETRTYTYGTPKHIAGGVQVQLDAEGDKTIVYADNIEYYVDETNSGYTGNLGLRIIPEEFRSDVLGETQDENGMWLEGSDDTHTEFALLFQFEGNKKPTRYCFYRCVAGRPSVTGKTREKNIEASEYSVPITAMSRENDKKIRAKITDSETNHTVFAAWYTAVTQPTVAQLA